MSAPDPVKQAWQASTGTMAVPSLDDIRLRAAKFDRQIRVRNGIEYAACIVVIGSFGAGFVQAPSLGLKLANLLIVLATFFVAWQLHRRGSAKGVPDSTSGPALLERHIRDLARQRDALRDIFWWYLLPFIPGQLLFFVMKGIVPGGEWKTVIGLTILVTVFGGIWWLNQCAAAKLDATIDELKAIEGDKE